MLIHKRTTRLTDAQYITLSHLWNDRNIDIHVDDYFFGDPKWFLDRTLSLPYEISNYMSDEEQPSKMEVHRDTGIVISERYYLNGKLHRKNGPAAVYYFPLHEEYYLENKFIGSNLHLYSEEDIQNYLLLK